MVRVAASRDVVVIGASAGGIGPLKELLGHLPTGLAASLLVVVHRTLARSPGQQDFLSDSLASVSKLTVVTATDGSVYRHGHVYVAPGRCRLVVFGKRLQVKRLPDESPSHHTIDETFVSAAETCGERVVAVLLSGMLDDGTSGIREVARHGGLTMVQDPAAAFAPSMPSSAMRDLPVHYCLKPPAMAQTIIRVASEPIPRRAPSPRVLIVEDERIAALSLEGQLRDMGYDVIGSVASGEEALALLATTSPDVVLMDIHLAGSMTGIEAGAVTWQRHHIPVVYVTAYSDQETVTAASLAKPYGFVVKPYRATQVHAALQLALDRRAREIGAPPNAGSR